MRFFHATCLFAFVLASVESCLRQDVEYTVPDATSLTFSVDLPSVMISTRAREMYSGVDAEDAGKIVTDPFGDDLSGWNDYEKLIDAREIYRLTLLLVDRTSGVLVGYRDLYEGSPDMKGSAAPEGGNGWWDGSRVVTDGKYATRAVVTFDYDHPLHVLGDGSSLEALDRGSYRMIVVANWSPVVINANDEDGQSYSREYPGLKNKQGVYFQELWESVRDQYAEQTTSSPLKFSEMNDYHEFMDFAIFSSAEFLCDLAPQPLFLVQDFDLTPGHNKIAGRLSRTWARLRVTVENVSHDVLTVDDMAFGENTTRDESYLFYSPGNEAGSMTDPSEDTRYGAPNIFKVPDEENGQYTNPYNALVATVKKTSINGLPDVRSEDTDDGNRRIMFDGYVLDGNGRGDPFTYSLSVRYDGKSVTKLKRAKNPDGTWAVNKSKPFDIIDNGLYVIQNQNSSKRVLYAGEGQLETVVLSNDGSGNFLDKDMYFEPAQVFRFIAVKDDDGNQMMEEVTNYKGDNPGKRESYPLFNIQTYDGLYWLGHPWGTTFHKNGVYTKNIPLLVSSAAPVSYVLRNDGEREGSKYVDMRYLSFYSSVASDDGLRHFINVNGNSSRQGQVDGWKDNDGGSQFYIHKVDEIEEGAAFSGTVTLSTIDPETSVSAPVKAIHRNDFINILITVSFNEKSGEIDFKVKDWNTGGGNIEFN